jgi:hypothetical protein
VKIDVESLAKDSRGKQKYNLPKWQNKTQRKVIKAEKYQLLYSVVYIFVRDHSLFMTGVGLAKFNEQLNKMSCPTPCITKKFNDPLHMNSKKIVTPPHTSPPPPDNIINVQK